MIGVLYMKNLNPGPTLFMDNAPSVYAVFLLFILANSYLDIEIQGPAILLAFAPQMSVDRIEFNLQRLAQIRSLLPQYLFTKT